MYYNLVNLRIWLDKNKGPEIKETNKSIEAATWDGYVYIADLTNLSLAPPTFLAFMTVDTNNIKMYAHKNLAENTTIN